MIFSRRAGINPILRHLLVLKQGYNRFFYIASKKNVLFFCFFCLGIVPLPFHDQVFEREVPQIINLKCK